MKSTMPLAASAACLLLAGGVPDPASAQPAKTAAAPTSSASATPKIEPDARAALNRMGAYLRTLQSFEVVADTSRDQVTDDGQKLQFDGTVTYQVRRPDGFLITTSDDRRVRKLYYDGKSLTLFSPRMGFYATVAAPANIKDTMALIQDRYGIEVPLVDLFKWGTPDDGSAKLISGYNVGYAKIGDVECDQYAFSQPGVNWQIWISKGDKALPLKVVITSLDDPTQPQYEAKLKWSPTETFAADTFSFKAPPDAKQIKIAQATP
jgi:hypothetical protein